MIEFWKTNDMKEWEQVDFDTALRALTSTFNDSDMVRDMLSIPNWIPYRFGVIQVKDGNRVAMPGLKYLVPDGMEYDEHGKRL